MAAMIVPVLVGVGVLGYVLSTLTRGDKNYPNLPDYAQPRKWPHSENLDDGLSGMTLTTVVAALDENSDPQALREAADMMEGFGFPIAADRLDEKADLIMRLKRDGYI